MDKTSLLYAKIAALKKNLESIKYDRIGRVVGIEYKQMIDLYGDLIKNIKEVLPDLYSDLPDYQLPKHIGVTEGGPIFEFRQFDPLVKNLDYVLEVRANSRIGEIIQSTERRESIFISHGRSKEWFKIQAFCEKDLHYPTIELAQQPNLGRTVLQKLDEESSKCKVAIIVMTGDDIIDSGEIRARENVLHEIGFFQGKYGVGKIVLLHEEGVNIPSNIHGLVYISFPKDTSETTLGALSRELKVLMS
jgi:predicted nucleotide-binding protein